MFKLKAAVLAAVTLVGASASFSASAITLAIPSTTSLGASYTSLGSFQFDYTFDIASSAYAALSGSSSGQTLSIPSLAISGQLFGISNLSVLLDSTSIPVVTSTGLPVSGTLGGVLPTVTTPSVSSFALSPTVIAAGSHHIKILGDVTGSNGGAYTAQLSLTPVPAPVPEPETYAMMLAGLGALGFLASRRRG